LYLFLINSYKEGIKKVMEDKPDWAIRSWALEAQATNQGKEIKPNRQYLIG
jgi:hypothetical protein